MIHSLFYMLGLVFVAGILIIYEMSRNDNPLLKYWLMGDVFYLLRLIFVIAGYINPHLYELLKPTYYSLALLIYGFSIISFNSGLNYIIAYDKFKKENYILLSLFTAVAVFFYFIDLNHFELIFVTHFTIGLGLLFLAFGTYRIWVEKKIREAWLLSINFGIWGLVTPIWLIYFQVHNSSQYLPIVESVFITIFLSISLFFISSLKRKKVFLYFKNYDSIFENSSDLLLLLDRNGRILKKSGNFFELFDNSRINFKKTKFADLIDPELQDLFLEKWGKVILGKKALATLKMDQSYLNHIENDEFDFIMEPLMDEDTIEMVSVIGRINVGKIPVVAEKQKGSEKVKIDVELENILSMTSHELQSPMIVLEGYVSALAHALKDVKLPPEVKEYPKYIIKNVKKVSDLIQAILDLSRVNSDNLNYTAVDLNQVFSRVEGDIVQLFSPGSYELVVDSNLPLVLGNKIQLTQLFLNLIKNSIKYGPEGNTPIIEVGIEDQDEKCVNIRLKDNGIGMNPKDIDKIFSPMHRLHKKNVEGYGIGLSLVKKIVEAHGAKINVESEEGVGSTFFIKLKKYKYEKAEQR